MVSFPVSLLPATVAALVTLVDVISKRSITQIILSEKTGIGKPEKRFSSYFTIAKHFSPYFCNILRVY